MKKVLLLALFVFLANVFAHGVLLLVEDNGDGTIYIEAGFSTGGAAANATVTLTDRATGRTIFTGNLDEKGRLNVAQPTEPYTVEVMVDASHRRRVNGPLPGQPQARRDRRAVD